MDKYSEVTSEEEVLIQRLLRLNRYMLYSEAKEIVVGKSKQKRFGNHEQRIEEGF